MDQPSIVHDARAQRFVMNMAPRPAFVTYQMSGKHITLTHIETPTEKRGTGLGARFALRVFPLVKALTNVNDGSASITCGFMRKVARSRPEWAQFFGLEAK